MPGLGNFPIPISTSASSSSSTLTGCSTLKTLDPIPQQHDSPLTITPSPVKTLVNGLNCGNGGTGARNGRKFVRVRVEKGGSCDDAKSLEEYVRDWTWKMVDSGAEKSRCFLPFLVGAKKLGDCLICNRFVSPEEELLCSVRNCRGAYHFKCAENILGVSHLKKFKCPQHECYLCKQKFQWRCVRCSLASHYKCAAWPDKVILLKGQPGRTICWRHPSNWRLGKEHKFPTGDMEEVFGRLPLPYNDEEFNIDFTRMDLKDNKLELPPYVHIRRNVYLVKKKRDDANFDIGCTSCSSTCCQDCVCRVQSISCSKSCHCSENCTNRPFRKEKKMKIVKTEFCGWGVEAAEPINKGDFVIEYIGEVIDDALCEKRLWDMKYSGVQNFYMCEVRKDFTIDASFKGNASRFLNHSCDPNCVLEKWQVEGETRVGVFAARAIEPGEPLTYDYRFVQFGPEVKCHCGSLKCQGYLGTKKRVSKLNICWGAKRRRSSDACLAIVSV